MEKVYVYESATGKRVSPPVVGLRGGRKLHLFNATGDDVIATFPEGAVNKSKPVVRIRAGGKAKVEVRAQGKVTAYTYTIKPAKGPKAKANSDPVLIIEN